VYQYRKNNSKRYTSGSCAKYSHRCKQLNFINPKASLSPHRAMMNVGKQKYYTAESAK
jgi:hypothetical protein